VEDGPKESGMRRVRSFPGSEFFTLKVSRRLTIFVCTYLLKQVLQTGSLRTAIATSSVWQRLQRLVVLKVSAGGGCSLFRDGILSLIYIPFWTIFFCGFGCGFRCS
jgi:hypothetical protein